MKGKNKGKSTAARGKQGVACAIQALPRDFAEQMNDPPIAKVFAAKISGLSYCPKIRLLASLDRGFN